MESENKPIIDAVFSAPGKVYLSGEYSVLYGKETNPTIAFTIGNSYSHSLFCSHTV